MALDVEFDRRRVELLAVLKLDAAAQLHDQGLVAVGPAPLGGELRDDGQLAVDIDELVAQRGKNDAADGDRARVGSRRSGSSPSPIRNVWADAPASADDTTSSAASKTVFMPATPKEIQARYSSSAGRQVQCIPVGLDRHSAPLEDQSVCCQSGTGIASAAAEDSSRKPLRSSGGILGGGKHAPDAEQAGSLVSRGPAAPSRIINLLELEVGGGELGGSDVVEEQLIAAPQIDNRIDALLGRFGLHLGERGQSRGADDHRHIAGRTRTGREIGHRVNPGAEPGQPADIDEVLRVGDQIVGVDEVVAGAAVDVVGAGAGHDRVIPGITEDVVRAGAGRDDIGTLAPDRVIVAFPDQRIELVRAGAAVEHRADPAIARIGCDDGIVTGAAKKQVLTIRAAADDILALAAGDVIVAGATGERVVAGLAANI